MAFATQTGWEAVDGGEQWTTSPCAATNYTSFKDGLEVGRFAQISAGVVSNLDGTDTPDIAGVVLRRATRAVDDGTAITAANNVDVDVADFGRVAVYVKAGDTPVEGGAVYAVNDTSADAGKATTDSTNGLAIANAVFYREVKAGVWVVTLKQYMK